MTKNRVTEDTYLEVTYVTIRGAGGQVRRYMSELVGWLEANPGALIVKLRRL